MNPWIILLLAGLFEICFATLLKLSEGFTKVVPTICFAVCAIASFGLLTMAIKHIPVGTAYAVWTGIGAFGAAVVGILFFRESADFWRVFFLFLLIGSLVGLKLVSPDHS
jgi:quaternary ammonium compound-resistance protein SugE